MTDRVFNIATVRVVPMVVADQQWVQFQFDHGGADSPLLVQMPASGFGEAPEDVSHAENVVKAFRQDVRDLGEYVAHKLLVRRIAIQRKMARETST